MNYETSKLNLVKEAVKKVLKSSGFEDEEQFTRLSKTLAQIGCTTFIPTVGTRDLESADLRKAKHTSWRNS